MCQALRVPDFRLLWGGGLISSLGSWLLVLAVPAHIFAVTGSLRATGLALAAQYLPQLALGPVTGTIADRWDRRRLMAGANLYCAGAVAVMLLGTAPGRYWVLYAALAAENCGTVLCAPAVQASTPAIVGTGPLLASANSLTSAGNGIVRLIGGPLGGILLAACGIRWLICADAFSYLLAAAAVCCITSRTGDGPPGQAATVGAVGRDLAEGWHALRAQPTARVLLPVTVVFLAANASLGALLVPFGIQRLGGGEHTGLLLSCLGVGFLLSAPVIRALLDRAGPRNLLTISLTATAGGYLALFTSSSLAAALPAAASVGMSGSMALVVQQTTVQRLIPGAVLGRVSAVFLAGEAAATLAGSVAGPFLAQAIGLAMAAAIASLVTLGAAALTFRAVPATALASRRRSSGDEARDDGPLRVSAVAVGSDVPCVPAGEDRDGFEEIRAGVEQADAVFGRISGGQFPVRDELTERGTARLVVQVVVDAVAAGKESQPAGERVEVVTERVGRPADVPAQAACAPAREHDARRPAFPQDLRQAVRAPHRDQIHDAAAADQDHVLAEQVLPDIGHVRLGEQLQEAELDVVTPGEQVREVVDSVLPVADCGRDEAQPPDTPA